ncbi:MAG: hypothetical protein ABIK43_01110 [candidate division WOR-3 bacterium]
MSEDLHSFIKGQLWLKLKADVQRLFVINRAELVSAAYFHIRRLLLIQPGWTCRVQPHGEKPDLLLHKDNAFRAAIRCEFTIRQDGAGFPAESLNSSMDMLRAVVNRLSSPGLGHGYLIGVFDSAEPELYPQDEEGYQVCHWLPINCHEFPNYSEWRAGWNRLVNDTSEINR